MEQLYFVLKGNKFSYKIIILFWLEDVFECSFTMHLWGNSVFIHLYIVKSKNFFNSKGGEAIKIFIALEISISI